MRVLWDTLQNSIFLSLFLQFCVSPSLSFFSSIEASSLSFLSKALSWWWNSFFHGLFPSGWCLLSPFLLYLPLHLHGGKTPLKDLIEAQRSNLHRSFTSKLPSAPLLREIKYDYWKELMISHFEYIRKDWWDVVENIDYIPYSDQLNEIPKLRFFLNTKAMNVMVCAFSEEEYKKVHSFKNTKQMWNSLDVTYEGTS